MRFLRPLLSALLLAFVAGIVLAAPADEERAQTVIHMLDYIGVDYPGFVQDGKVLDEGEFQEQREFATQSVALLERLPAAPEQAALVARARQLLARIDARAPGAEVSAAAAALRGDVIRAWKLSVAPRQAPDLARAGALFQANCAACHGAQGRGDGPLAKGLDPQPSNFHDAARMDQRSIYGLYNTCLLYTSPSPRDS